MTFPMRPPSLRENDYLRRGEAGSRFRGRELGSRRRCSLRIGYCVQRAKYLIPHRLVSALAHITHFTYGAATAAGFDGTHRIFFELPRDAQAYSVVV